MRNIQRKRDGGKKKYHTPAEKLTKTEHKKRKKAVRACVKTPRGETKKVFAPSSRTVAAITAVKL